MITSMTDGALSRLHQRIAESGDKRDVHVRPGAVPEDHERPNRLGTVEDRRHLTVFWCRNELERLGI